MSRGKLGSKANKRAANAAYQRQLRERKRLRRERREENEAKYGIFAPPEPKTGAQHRYDYFNHFTVPELRGIAKAASLKLPSRAKKADLISAIVEHAYE